MPEILFHEPFVPDALVLDKNGVWTFHGKRFENEKIARLFSRSIRFDREKDQYFLSIGRFTSPFKVEETPFFVEYIAFGEDGLCFSLNTEEQEKLNEPYLVIGDDGQLYLPLPESESRRSGERAKFTRHAYVTLLDLGSLEEVDGSFHLTISSLRITLLRSSGAL